MPTLVPTRPDDPATEANRAAWAALTGPTPRCWCAFSDGDPITGGDGPILRAVDSRRGRAATTR